MLCKISNFSAMCILLLFITCHKYICVNQPKNLSESNHNLLFTTFQTDELFGKKEKLTYTNGILVDMR